MSEILLPPKVGPTEYRENVSEVYWAVSMNKIEKPEVNSKDVTVRINYYDKASGN